jgi:hypothetical protein
MYFITKYLKNGQGRVKQSIPLERPERRWVDNIKMNLVEIG